MFKILFFLFLFLLLLLPRKIFAKEPIFLIIHQIRGEESCCEPGSTNFIESLKEKKDFHNLSFAWALRFDALEDDRYIDYLKDFGELGLLLEITPNLASKSGVLYRGKVDGSNWYFAKNAFLVGCSQTERKKLLDTLFATFKKKFGYWPSFTVSWMIDAWSIDYINRTYQVKLHELTKEQYETDSYTLYGGVFNAPYYPSRDHPFLPGQESNRLNLIIVRQTISDILYNYGSPKAYFTSQPNDYLENPEKKDILYFKNLIKETINQPSEFQFGVLGFENSYSWQKYGDEYKRQLEFISEEQEEGRLRTVLPSEYASEFRKNYKENPSFYFVKDFSPEKELGVLWYFGKTYRARILLKDDKLILDDLRIYTEIADPYKDNPAEADYSYWILPYLIDGSQQYQYKAQSPPGGSLTSDTLTSPFGIVLGEGGFNLKTKDSIVEIEFISERKGTVKFLPEEILIDNTLNPFFSQPYSLVIDDFFNNQKEINLQFNRQFDFTIRPNLSFRVLRQAQDKLRRGISYNPTLRNNIIKSKELSLGWKKDNDFISLLTIQKDDNQLILIPQTKQKNLHLLNPMFQPDRSGLSVDPQKSIFYWNNKEAIAGRNPARLFILPLNELERPVQVRDVEVTFNTDQPLNIIYPDDYSYRLTPWFVDISSNIALRTEVNIIVDGQEVIKDMPIEFITDCQKNIQDCTKKPNQLVKYLLALLNEQRIKLIQFGHKLML